MFFKKKNIHFKKLFPSLNLKKDFLVNDVKPLGLASKKEITFFDSINYKKNAITTKASACITTQKLEKFLPKNVNKIIVKNVLFELARIIKIVYPFSDIDYPDLSVKKPKNSDFKNVRFGNNVLIGKNVKIGKNSIIGSNSIIEHDVRIGNDCVIGSGVVIKNTLIGDKVVIQDCCKIGQKGFGFLPVNEKNIKFPHIGKVCIKDNVEIGSSCTIDRGSIDDTIIGKNTYLDNQVHVAHNVQIGSNCMIAGQVGFAGSSKIGNNVSIGGQAGISGHLKIGNNVKIGGGSGVVKDIEDNKIVMGYPAVPLKDFLKNNKKNNE
ncbi:MAG: UDP-3-O-(3-hydroxymyristoyl)glucosamine N-acyltransferase [Candidatus Pelagibacter bacterium]|nr:UDP-3-O-(3-hydroxymyristoyl)glucosamine N-acyltransferase [Candidatus Pelagibacter bacterium]MBL6861149.1 UDP-3-O-(3-hydroxymyristoyl)glucosamine N-acyltransferase [Candidatus Pelagibacter bacterium]